MRPESLRRLTAFTTLALAAPAGPGARASAEAAATRPLPVTRLAGVTFLTADFGPLRRFYGGGAGFPEAPTGPGRIRFGVGGGQWIEFEKAPDANWPRRFQHVTLEAADLDLVAQELRAHGVAVTRTGRDRTIQIADPAGNWIWIAAAPARQPAAQGAAFSSHLQHVGMAVPYPLSEATISFYRDKLGLAEGFRMNGPDGRLALAKFRLPSPSDEVIELIFFDPPQNKWAAGASDHVDFEVGDIDAAYRLLHKGGIATTSRHLPTVNGENLWAIDVFDPELTRMEVQASSPANLPVGTVSSVGGDSAVAIFDGKTLNGWEGNLDNWRVEDGGIVAGALDRRQPHNEFLATRAEYGDFELRLKYRVEGTGGFVNGGVQFWSQRVPGSFEVSGYQADLGADTDGNLYDESRRNVNLATAAPGIRGRALRRGGWNEYRIRAEGAHIEIWLNGAKTVDYTEKDHAVARRGRFALQIHGSANTKVFYRDLQLEQILSSGGR